MAASQESVPAFLDKRVEFPDGQSYELLQPLTNYRSCHDGTPQEARMVFLCKQIGPLASEVEFVVKVKVQWVCH